MDLCGSTVSSAALSSTRVVSAPEAAQDRLRVPLCGASRWLPRAYDTRRSAVQTKRCHMHGGRAEAGSFAWELECDVWGSYLEAQLLNTAWRSMWLLEWLDPRAYVCIVCEGVMEVFTLS